jgi:hypothetical protein
LVRDRGAVLSAARWSTDEESASDVEHFTEKIPGDVTPAAYGVPGSTTAT